MSAKTVVYIHINQMYTYTDTDIYVSDTPINREELTEMMVKCSLDDNDHGMIRANET